MELDIDNTGDSTGVFPNELDAKLSSGWSLIDVREDDEWTYGHHEEAKHVKTVSYTHLTLPTIGEV